MKLGVSSSVTQEMARGVQSILKTSGCFEVLLSSSLCSYLFPVGLGAMGT